MQNESRKISETSQVFELQVFNGFLEEFLDSRVICIFCLPEFADVSRVFNLNYRAKALWAFRAFRACGRGVGAVRSRERQNKAVFPTLNIVCIPNVFLNEWRLLGL